MAAAPPLTPYRPAPEIASIADMIGDAVAPANFPETRLRFRNDRAAASVGLAGLSDAEWTAHFGRFQPLPGNLPAPLALRYHGHQFRVYNPDIGDGRGFLFAQLRDDSDRLLDLGTKGSGTTPYSRFGDGRLTLKGGVRELLATAMLEALGVPTSRSFSLIETGEALIRGDEPSPTRSAVLVRLSYGHIRIGSFERLATLGLQAEMSRLVDWCLAAYFPEADGPDPAAALFAAVVPRVAAMTGRMIAAGFVHGVLNSDNINITGESFDYGPWRFAPRWDPGFTAAYFDAHGLYAFGRQAEAVHWNLAQLASALRPLTDAAPLITALEGFALACDAALVAHILWRLGWRERDPASDRALASAAIAALSATEASIDGFFHDWSGRPDHGFADPGSTDPAWASFAELARRYTPWRERRHAYWDGPPCTLLIEEVEALWAAIASDDDWAPLAAKLAAIGQFGEILAR